MFLIFLVSFTVLISILFVYEIVYKFSIVDELKLKEFLQFFFKLKRLWSVWVVDQLKGFLFKYCNKYKKNSKNIRKYIIIYIEYSSISKIEVPDMPLCTMLDKYIVINLYNC